MNIFKAPINHEQQMADVSNIDFDEIYNIHIQVMTDPFVCAIREGMIDKIKELTTTLGSNYHDYSGCPMLIRAAMEGDCKIVKYLLEQGADPDATDSRQNTAIVTAAMICDLEMAGILMDYKANPYIANIEGHGPIYYSESDLRMETFLKVYIEQYDER